MLINVNKYNVQFALNLLFFLKKMKRISEFNYNGPSMSPVLKPGDGIVVNKIAGLDTFKVGDIICFRPENFEYFIIHRIIKITKNGIITRGDNNSENDIYLIDESFEPILVTGIRRGNKTIKVYGGTLGYLNQKKNIIFKKLRIIFKSSLKRILDQIAEYGIFYSMNIFKNRIKVLNYKMNYNEYDIMLLNKKQIGKRYKGQDWNIRQPWRLFINPNNYK